MLIPGRTGLDECEGREFRSDRAQLTLSCHRLVVALVERSKELGPFAGAVQPRVTVGPPTSSCGGRADADVSEVPPPNFANRTRTVDLMS